MKRGFATKKEALEWERDLLLRESFSMDMKFSDFVEVYFSDKGPRLKQRSIMTKRTLIETKIIPTFGDKKMNEITAIFNHAERFYDLRNNPCKKLDKMGRPNAKELNFWTKEEFDTFIRDFVEGEEMYRMIYRILFWLGCRVGELLALTPADVDLEKRTVSISKTYYRRDKQDFITSPKTESSNRKITIPEFLQKELKDFLDRQ